ncbi:MAG: carbohydrate ABC transporter permease [Candidatus Abyssobacteria bacterium SURF_5]|jgi:multiple sugar transport system permease protein|uniref:Carbohydrate ABC transporter permease n=1 Tax=Abyssobacteria bacterium (strain SURF_5) TaxID=2093360 RepID=A0A3A4NGI8_ABYX5|nr:MAG: carbohydrate ABC transporter permease [Candidatus Abyssubacteria bacterium SURF_5]
MRFRKNEVLLVSLLLLGAVISLFPALWMLYSSFRPNEELSSIPPMLLHRSLTTQNYAQLLSSAPVIRWTVNSFFICAIITLGQLLFDSMAGYAFAKKKFAGRQLLFWLVIGTMMVPVHILIVPLYIMMVKLHLVDTLWAAILPGLAGSFGIFFMRQFISTIPTALEEAARMDGCSEFQVFFRIILPLCAPALGVLAIFLFISNWNSFLWPLLVLNSAQTYTLTVGLATLQDKQTLDYGLLMAGAVLASLPMFIVFIMFQRWFVQGMRIGAIKG